MSESFVVRIPLVDIQKIVEGNGAAAIEALGRLSSPWALVIRDEEGRFVTEGYDDQSECSDRVAKFRGSSSSVLYVLKHGIPRKNVRIEVKARFR